MNKSIGKFDSILEFIKEDSSITSPSTIVMPTIDGSIKTPKPSEGATLADLLQYKNGMDIGENKKKILGVPLQNIFEELVTSYLRTKDLQARFKDAAKNPVYRDKPELKPVFKRLEQCITTIQTQIKVITKELDNLSLDS